MSCIFSRAYDSTALDLDAKHLPTATATLLTRSHFKNPNCSQLLFTSSALARQNPNGTGITMSRSHRIMRDGTIKAELKDT